MQTGNCRQYSCTDCCVHGIAKRVGPITANPRTNDDPFLFQSTLKAICKLVQLMVDVSGLRAAGRLLPSPQQLNSPFFFPAPFILKFSCSPPWSLVQAYYLRTNSACFRQYEFPWLSIVRYNNISIDREIVEVPCILQHHKVLSKRCWSLMKTCTFYPCKLCQKNTRLHCTHRCATQSGAFLCQLYLENQWVTLHSWVRRLKCSLFLPALPSSGARSAPRGRSPIAK